MDMVWNQQVIFMDINACTNTYIHAITTDGKRGYTFEKTKQNKKIKKNQNQKKPEGTREGVEREKEREKC